LRALLSPSPPPSFFPLLPPPPKSPLFPYTTLFRSHICGLAKKYGAAVVAGTIDEDKQSAMARTADRKLSIAKRLRDLAVEKYGRSEEHTSELQSLTNLVCRLLLEKKKQKTS